MRILTTISLFLSIIIGSTASPALKKARLIRLQDGTTIAAYLVGDEHASCLVTADGYIVEQVAGNYQITNKKRQVSATPTRETRAAIGSQTNAAIKAAGSPTIPVILVNFSDKAFTLSKDYMERHFNEEGFSELSSSGSVRDYFVAQSAGLFTPTFEVIGPVTLPENAAYYGSNNDQNIRQMYKDALDKAKLLVDFSKYPTQCVAMIYAGEGEHSGGDADCVWAKFVPNCLHNVGNATMTSFFCTNELIMIDDRLQADGIGVFCHEFSHALGLPDFYDTEGKAGVFGLDLWSLMDYGQYWWNGYRPVGYSAYEKNFMGWLPLISLTKTPQTLSLPPLGAPEQCAYKIPNSASANEYYILENRQASAYYPALAGAGMLVFHIDYSSSAWSESTVNNVANHQRMTLIPADGRLSTAAEAYNDETGMNYVLYQGDPYPGIANNTSLTSFTTPSDTAYVGKYMGIQLTNIRVGADGAVTFDYMGGEPSAIVFPSTEDASLSHIFALDGRYIGRAEDKQDLLPAGIYLIRKGTNIYKLKIK